MDGVRSTNVGTRKHTVWWEKKPLGSPRDRWEDNIKMDLKTIMVRRADWINMAHDRYKW
jgi:hypothetical protein